MNLKIHEHKKDNEVLLLVMHLRKPIVTFSNADAPTTVSNTHLHIHVSTFM